MCVDFLRAENERLTSDLKQSSLDQLAALEEVERLKRERDQLREQLAAAKNESQREVARLEHVEIRYGLSRMDIDKERGK